MVVSCVLVALFVFTGFANAVLADDSTVVLDLSNSNLESTDAPRTDTLEDSADSVPTQRGDFNDDGKLDLADIDILSMRIKGGTSDQEFDLDHDGFVSEKDLAYWIKRLRHSFVGDADLDGEFNSGDMVAVFQAGAYESGETGAATWKTGDWNGDANFDSGDLVMAFQQKGYETGPRIPAARPKSVPEPVGLSILGMALVFLLITYTLFHRKSA